MALPTAYTEDALKTFMLDELGATGAAIGLSAASFAESINDILLTLGVANVPAVTNIPLLRAMARRVAWQKAANETAGDYAFSTDGESRQRQQVHAQCLARVADAQTAVTALTTTSGTGGIPARPWSGSVRVESGW